MVLAALARAAGTKSATRSRLASLRRCLPARAFEVVDSTTGDSKDETWKFGGWQAPDPPTSARRYTFRLRSSVFRRRCELWDDAGTMVAEFLGAKVRVVGGEGKEYRNIGFPSGWLEGTAREVVLREHRAGAGAYWELAGERVDAHFSMSHRSRMYPKRDPNARGLAGFTDNAGNVLLTVRFPVLRMSTAEVILYANEQPVLLLFAFLAVLHFQRESARPSGGG
jgi:hypothetical protein